MRGFEWKFSVCGGLLPGGIVKHRNGPEEAVQAFSWEVLEFQHGEAQSLI